MRFLSGVFTLVGLVLTEAQVCQLEVRVEVLEFTCKVRADGKTVASASTTKYIDFQSKDQLSVTNSLPRIPFSLSSDSQFVATAPTLRCDQTFLVTYAHNTSASEIKLLSYSYAVSTYTDISSPAFYATHSAGSSPITVGDDAPFKVVIELKNIPQVTPTDTVAKDFAYSNLKTASSASPLLISSRTYSLDSCLTGPLFGKIAETTFTSQANVQPSAPATNTDRHVSKIVIICGVGSLTAMLMFLVFWLFL